jgi:small subunit ribosomal protein S6e
MAFKINISEKTGKTYKIEVEENVLVDKKLHDTIEGSLLNPELQDYEFEITGTSDKAGFTSMKGVPGIALKKVLLTYGKGMKRHPRKEGKKEISNKTPKGLRLRKTVRGEVISPAIVQINLKVLKEGSKKLAEVFAPKEEPEAKTSE